MCGVRWGGLVIRFGIRGVLGVVVGVLFEGVFGFFK